MEEINKSGLVREGSSLENLPISRFKEHILFVTLREGAVTIVITD
jgi:hypothetical protein